MLVEPCRINQSLYLLSAISFLVAYAVAFQAPASVPTIHTLAIYWKASIALARGQRHDRLDGVDLPALAGSTVA